MKIRIELEVKVPDWTEKFVQDKNTTFWAKEGGQDGRWAQILVKDMKLIGPIYINGRKDLKNNL